MSTPETKTASGRECVTHHNACECREAMFAAREEEVERLRERIDILSKGWPAADILRVEAENKRLREALDWIRDGIRHFTNDEDRGQVEYLTMKIDGILALKVHGGGQE